MILASFSLEKMRFLETALIGLCVAMPSVASSAPGIPCEKQVLEAAKWTESTYQITNFASGITAAIKDPAQQAIDSHRLAFIEKITGLPNNFEPVFEVQKPKSAGLTAALSGAMAGTKAPSEIGYTFYQNFRPLNFMSDAKLKAFLQGMKDPKERAGYLDLKNKVIEQVCEARFQTKEKTAFCVSSTLAKEQSVEDQLLTKNRRAIESAGDAIERAPKDRGARGTGLAARMGPLQLRGPGSDEFLGLAQLGYLIDLPAEFTAAQELPKVYNAKGQYAGRALPIQRGSTVEYYFAPLQSGDDEVGLHENPYFLAFGGVPARRYNAIFRQQYGPLSLGAPGGEQLN